MVNWANFCRRELLRGGFAIKNHLQHRLAGRLVESAFTTIYIRPNEIKWKLKRSRRNVRVRNVGGIVDGDWDHDVHEAIGLKYEGIYERFVEGYAWENTGLFRQRYAPALRRGQRVRGCSTVQELVRQYEARYDTLYASIEKHGVMKAALFGSTIQPTYVFVGRGGEILWFNGNHRLYLAKILDVVEMPVRVWARHRKWQDLRERIARDNNSFVSHLDPKLLDHPDLEVLLGSDRKSPAAACEPAELDSFSR